MKAYKTNKAYKVEYKNWTQPVFSSNELTEDGVWYKLTASRGQGGAFKAFDGDTTTNQRCWWSGKINLTNANPDWICLECDHKLKLTSVDIMNEKYQPENPKYGSVQVSDDGITWKEVGSFIGTNKASYVTTVPLAVDRGYRFYRCYFTENWADGVSLQEITFYGQIATVVEDGGTGKAYKKITGYEDWAQPVFTSQVASDGSMITCSSQDSQYNNFCWRAMDGNKDVTTSNGDGNQWSAYANSAWWKVEFPYYIAITKLVHCDRGGANYRLTSARYYADENMKTPIGGSFSTSTAWEAVTVYDSETPIITNVIYFKGVLSHETYGGIGELEITAQKVLTEPATPEDYDIVEDLEFETFKTETKVSTVTQKTQVWCDEENKLNISKVGSPTINKGIVSGFSSSNFVSYYKATPSAKTFEAILKVKTGSDVTTKQAICAGLAYNTLGAILLANGTLQLHTSSNGTSNDIAGGVASTAKLVANTNYWIKYSFNGSKYIIDVSVDGVDYVNYISVSTSAVVNFGGYCAFGVDTGAYNQYPWLGSIDIRQSFIKINGNIWWQNSAPAYPITVCKMVSEKRIIKLDLDKEPNFIKVGSPTIKNGVMSGFSDSNYALVPVVPTNVTSYEIVAKFTTGALDGIHKGVLANSVTNRRTPQIIVSDGNKINLDHPQDADTWVGVGAIVATANTTYWTKLAWDGNTLYGYYKTSANSDWIFNKSVATASVHWTEQIGIGIDTGLPFDGSIDLNECYIKINGQMWWSANREVT